MSRDFLWAIRSLRKRPLFTLAIVLMLALGIGANTAVFSVVDAVLLQPPPYDSTRLIRIEESNPQRVMNGVPVPDYLYWSTRTDLFEKTVPFLKDLVTVTGAGDPDQVTAMRTGGTLFPMLRVHAALGRTLTVQDDSFNAPDVVVLSDRFWRSHFQADPSAIGKTIRILDKPHTIVGVMPREFEFSQAYDLWTPLRLTPALAFHIQVVARVKSGISVDQVQSAMPAITQQLIAQDSKKAGLKITVSPWRDVLPREYELTLLCVLAAVSLVLLIACADVGSLLLSRALERQKEIAIRASLGAGLRHIVRQLLAESLLLSAAGTLFGLLVAQGTVRFLATQLLTLPVGIPHIHRVALNERVLLFNVVLCVLLACLLSLSPALLAARDLQPNLRSGQAAGRSRLAHRMFSLLIAAETAFAFLLLTGSGLVIRSLIKLQSADHGFHPEHVLTARVPIGTLTQVRPTGKYDTKPRQMAYYRELLGQIERIPGIAAVAVVNNLPLSGVNTSTAVRTSEGLPLLTSTRTISPRYFEVMGVPLLAGRAFNEHDGQTSPNVAIINDYLARQLYPDRDPIGQLVPSPEAGAPPVTIVGVVANVSQNSYEQPAKGEVYRPYQQYIFGVFLSTVVIRTTADPLSLAPAVRQAIWSIEKDQPILKIETMDNIIATSIWRPRFSAWMLAILGALALLLTSAGLYSVVAYTTTLRTREIGIRMAMGATPSDIARVVVRDVLLPVAAGLIASAALSLMLARYLRSILYETAVTDLSAYIAAAALLTLVGLLACVHPAWRAATSDPLHALRTE